MAIANTPALNASSLVVEPSFADATREPHWHLPS